jgi:hypothetical protein
MKSQTKLFIRNQFFKSDHPQAKAASDALLDCGTCVVSGIGKIWIGGIENSIKRNIEENFVGCTRLNFDKEAFLKSEFYQSRARQYIEEIQKEIEAIVKDTIPTYIIAL